jgi:amino acid transporter
MTNFAVFATFIIINGALISLRLKEKKPFTKGFRAPFNIKKIPVTAVLGLFSSLFLMFQLPMFVILGGVGLLVGGAVFHKVIS